MNGMYWITRGGFVVQQRGATILADGGSKIKAYNVPTGEFRGLLRLDRLRPATRYEICRAIWR